MKIKDHQCIKIASLRFETILKHLDLIMHFNHRTNKTI